MSDDETPKVGDTIETQILRDESYRYLFADNIVVTHMRGGNATGLELHAVATETALISNQVEITEVGSGSPPAGRPIGVGAMTNQVHIGTMRLEVGVAVDMLVAVIGHMKRQNLGDLEKMKLRIQESLDS